MVDRTDVDENGNIIIVKVSSDQLLGEIAQFKKVFDEYSTIVKKDVAQKWDLAQRLENQKARLVELQLDDEKNAMSDLSDDPLDLIESNYPYFPPEDECAFNDLTVRENPKQCVEEMAQFVSVIHENLHRFKHLPKGPLYCNMKVKDKKWAPLVEHVLRPFMFTFLVDNIVDQLVLEELIQEHFPDGTPGTVTKKGTVVPKHFVFAFQNNDYQIPSRVTRMTGIDIENMLDSICFVEEIWGTFFSRTIKIEKVFFMDNENIAFLMMSHIADRAPGVCIAAYTLDGYIINPFPAFRSRRVKFCQEAMYLSCLPNGEIGKTISRIKTLERKIKHIEGSILRARRFQLLYAKRIDCMWGTHRNVVLLEEMEKRRALPSSSPSSEYCSFDVTSPYSIPSSLQELLDRLKEKGSPQQVTHSPVSPTPLASTNVAKISFGSISSIE